MLFHRHFLGELASCDLVSALLCVGTVTFVCLHGNLMRWHGDLVLTLLCVRTGDLLYSIC